MNFYPVTMLEKQQCYGNIGSTFQLNHCILHEGWSCGQTNTFGGIRQSTAETYIKCARQRSNLHLLTEAHVTKIIFEGNNRYSSVRILLASVFKHISSVLPELYTTSPEVYGPSTLPPKSWVSFGYYKGSQCTL